MKTTPDDLSTLVNAALARSLFAPASLRRILELSSSLLGQVVTGKGTGKDAATIVSLVEQALRVYDAWERAKARA